MIRCTLHCMLEDRHCLLKMMEIRRCYPETLRARCRCRGSRDMEFLEARCGREGVDALGGGALEALCRSRERRSV